MPVGRANKYSGHPGCRAEMYAGCVACCPLMSHGEYADETDRRTDGRTPDRYITLSARRHRPDKPVCTENPVGMPVDEDL